MNYNLYSAGFPGMLYAGNGSIKKLHEIAEERKIKSMIMLVDNAVKESELITEEIKELGSRYSGMITDIKPEPTHDSIYSVYNEAKAKKADMIVAIGGGSIMDVAKVVAAALANNEFAEQKMIDTSMIHNKAIPTVMIPTTAGTGAEATPNAIFLFPEQNLKIGLVSPEFAASYIILEPGLTINLPKKLTASTGIDALCHAVEAYISLKANPVSSRFSEIAVKYILENIKKAYDNGNDIDAREKMLLGSFFAGMCLFSSTTVAVHALSYPLGGKYHIAHGISNAILLPEVLRVNKECSIKKYADLYGCIDEKRSEMSDEIAAEKFTVYIEQLCRYLQIPAKLTEFGIKASDIDYLADNAIKVQRLLSNNPKKLEKTDIKEIYAKLI